jgi:hypothetical protein
MNSFAVQSLPFPSLPYKLFGCHSLPFTFSVLSFLSLSLSSLPLPAL